MSLIEATIRVHSGGQLFHIDVEYGAGKGRVPRNCQTICQVVKPCFEQGAVDSIRKTLRATMDDVEIRVVREIDFRMRRDRAEGSDTESSDFTEGSDNGLDQPKLVRQ